MLKIGILKALSFKKAMNQIGTPINVWSDACCAVSVTDSELLHLEPLCLLHKLDAKSGDQKKAYQLDDWYFAKCWSGVT